jgi:hypothetical protein
MKKSDLKKHIKEEILSILKEASTALVTSKGGTKPVSFSSPSELNALKTDSNVTSITTTAGQKIKETESTETYMISKAGSKGIPYYVLEKPDGSKQIDMMFSSPEEAKKYATKKNLKLSSKKGYNMNEAKEINGIPGTVTIGGGKSGILIPTNQGDYIYYVTDDEYNAFINAGGNAQKLMATIFLKSGKAKPYKPKYNPMASLGGGKGYHIDEDKIESDFFEREPKSKDIEKGEGIIAKTKNLLNFQKELKTLSKDMQDLAAEYREAEGSDKDEILRSLKVKTAAKKELEKKIEQLEKYV